MGIALERMYVLDGGQIGRKLRNRAARYLATDAVGQEAIREGAREFYDMRSDIVHNRLHRLSPQRVHAAFGKGFDIARRSLFKLLREGPPEDWNAVARAGAEACGPVDGYPKRRLCWWFPMGMPSIGGASLRRPCARRFAFQAFGDRPSTVTVHYPFHPLHCRCLEVVAWPRQPHLAVTVRQPDGQTLKIRCGWSNPLRRTVSCVSESS